MGVARTRFVAVSPRSNLCRGLVVGPLLIPAVFNRLVTGGLAARSPDPCRKKGRVCKPQPYSYSRNEHNPYSEVEELSRSPKVLTGKFGVVEAWRVSNLLDTCEPGLVFRACCTGRPGHLFCTMDCDCNLTRIKMQTSFCLYLICLCKCTCICTFKCIRAPFKYVLGPFKYVLGKFWI